MLDRRQIEIYHLDGTRWILETIENRDNKRDLDGDF